ncbi:MAG TPA: PAS domain S-box protein, partial [Sulfurimonas sp.]|nr:PAS domain S-box protein [Sulfurimonas sp.]
MEQVEVLDSEYLFQGRVIISETDLKGVITYANRKFCEISGYTKEELIGQTHNIIRHPDMPKEVFIKVWNTISSGQIWHGLIKNLRKDGQYYWVETEVVPSKDMNGEVIGYVAARKAASRKDVQETSLMYQKMKA